MSKFNYEIVDVENNEVMGSGHVRAGNLRDAWIDVFAVFSGKHMPQRNSDQDFDNVQFKITAASVDADDDPPMPDDCELCGEDFATYLLTPDLIAGSTDRMFVCPECLSLAIDGLRDSHDDPELKVIIETI
jgi:hypothetical protein